MRLLPASWFTRQMPPVAAFPSLWTRASPIIWLSSLIWLKIDESVGADRIDG